MTAMDPKVFLEDLLNDLRDSGADIQSSRLSDDMLHVHMSLGHREYVLVLVPTDMDDPSMTS